MILHSSIWWSHNRPNQFSEQMHANLRAELGTVIDDSRHSPCSPHGLIGTHNEDGGAAGVELDCGVVVDHDGVVEDHEGVVGGHEDVVVGHEGLVGSQDGVVEGHEGSVTIGLTMYRNKGVLFVKTICFIYFLEVEELQLMANYMLHEVHPRQVHHMNVSKHCQIHHIDNIYDNL